ENPDMAVAVAKRVLKALEAPFVVDSHTLRVAASIGISVSSDASSDKEGLLKNAETAMDRAKGRGGGLWGMYDSEMSAGGSTRLSMENALFEALEKNELLLHYQPLIAARTGRIAGVEALIRWQHPEYGLVPPGEFIPIAEETGLIGAIGEWSLRTACEQMQ